MLLPTLCAEIHYTALRRALGGLQRDTLPATLPLSYLQEKVRLQGAGVCISHPADLAVIFHGATLGDYQTIAALYCTRLTRTIPMIWQIMCYLAQQAQREPLSYEAVWAICLHLEERRAAATAMTTLHEDTSWAIVAVTPGVLIDAAVPYPATLACVVNVASGQVLAFRTGPPADLKQNIRLALYDALCDARRPALQSATGLAWSLPYQVLLDPMLPDCLAVCTALDIAVEAWVPPPALLQVLAGDWAADLGGHVIHAARFALLFDNYLQKAHGYGPQQARERRDHALQYATGYGRDPGEQFPALRQLLPAWPAYITADGVVPYQGRHYKDPLLSGWRNCAVTIQPSAWDPFVAWIYLEDALLCQAAVRNTRRPPVAAGH